MEEVSLCEICSERFSAGERDPLALPCGHTFCRKCLTRMKEENKDTGFACPSCRRVQSSVDLSTLPVIYKLFSSDREGTGNQYEMCQTHGDELTYWCQKCQKKLCGLCLFRGHPQDHEVVKAKVSFEETKYRLKQRIWTWQKDVNAKHRIILQRAKAEFQRLYQSQSQLSRSKKIIKELLPEIEDSCDMETILEMETKIKSLMVATDSICNDSGIPEMMDVSKQEKSGHSDAFESHPDKKPGRFCGCVESANGRRAMLEWHDDKLLLPAFSDDLLYSDLLFRMPSQVFLQLSIQEEPLGKVIIQPFYHLRRAHHFAALCQGIYGPSYIGSPFRCVENRSRPREYLSGGGYFSPKDGALIYKDLMTGLEWDSSETTGSCRQGAVLAVWFGTGSESGFGICTRVQEGGTFKCVFGEVVSGMEIVRAAVRHQPVTDVVISKCGVIVPDFMS